MYREAGKRALAELAEIIPVFVETLDEIKDDFSGAYGEQLTKAIINIESARDQILLVVENMNRQKG